MSYRRLDRLRVFSKTKTGSLARRLQDSESRVSLNSQSGKASQTLRHESFDCPKTQCLEDVSESPIFLLDYGTLSQDMSAGLHVYWSSIGQCRYMNVLYCLGTLAATVISMGATLRT